MVKKRYLIHKQKGLYYGYMLLGPAVKGWNLFNFCFGESEAETWDRHHRWP